MILVHVAAGKNIKSAVDCDVLLSKFSLIIPIYYCLNKLTVITLTHLCHMEVRKILFGERLMPSTLQSLSQPNALFIMLILFNSVQNRFKLPVGRLLLICPLAIFSKGLSVWNFSLFKNLSYITFFHPHI